MRGNRAQYRIVRVALLRASIEGLPIDWHQWRVEQQPYHQVRIGDEGLAECDEISAAIRDGLVCACLIESIVGYDETAEQAFQVFVVEGWNRQARGVAFNNMKIAKALFRQLFCDVVEQGLRIAVGYIVLGVLRRNSYARAFGAGGGADCIDDFH